MLSVAASGDAGSAATVETHVTQYFRRPMIPSIDRVPGAAAAFSDMQLPKGPCAARGARSRDAVGISLGVQTDFREIEVQTDPWSAPLDDAGAGAGAAAREIRTLVGLTYANGLLPAHEETMAAIDRVKQQEAQDELIPPPLDPTKKAYTAEELRGDARRRRMLVERDVAEWARREDELRRVQDMRLEMLIARLAEREEARTAIRTRKLERMRDRHEAGNARRAGRLAAERVQTLKKLAQGRDAALAQMGRRSGAHASSSRTVVDVGGRPMLSLPETFSTATQVRQAIFGANTLNAPFLSPGQAPYRYTGVIKLAGTDLRTQRDFDEVLQFMPDEARLTLGAPLNHTRSAQTARIASGAGRTQPGPPGPPGRQGRAAGRSCSVTGEDPLPRFVPPPGMSYAEYNAVSAARSRRLARSGAGEGEGVFSATAPVPASASTSAPAAAGAAAAAADGASAPPTAGGGGGLGATAGGKARVQPLLFQDPPSVEGTRVFDAALFVQSLIRGAAAQVRLYNGKERRLGLVRELRLAHELVSARQDAVALSANTQERLAALRAALATGAVSAGVAGVLGATLDALAKERVCREQVGRAAAILEIAVRERRRREDEESARRGREVYDRARTQFRRAQAADAHRHIADALLARVGRRAVADDADARGRELAARQVEALVALDAESSQAYMRSPQDAVRDLVRGFLVPEVDRRMLVARVRRAQEGVTLAARVLPDALDKAGVGCGDGGDGGDGVEGLRRLAARADREGWDSLDGRADAGVGP